MKKTNRAVIVPMANLIRKKIFRNRKNMKKKITAKKEFWDYYAMNYLS